MKSMKSFSCTAERNIMMTQISHCSILHLKVFEESSIHNPMTVEQGRSEKEKLGDSLEIWAYFMSVDVSQHCAMMTEMISVALLLLHRKSANSGTIGYILCIFRLF